MNKEQLELSKAISRGITDGIVKAAQMQRHKEMTLFDHAKAIHDECKAQHSCVGCPLCLEDYEVFCAVGGNSPSRWELEDIK